jgi:uncharacterized RDD family membrane protein YckC
MAGIGITVLKRNAPWGPFTREQIEEGLKRGDFTVNYLAHAPGLKEWLPLGEVLDYLQRHPNASGVELPPIPTPVNLPPPPQMSTRPTGPPPQTRPPILSPPRQPMPSALEQISSMPVPESVIAEPKEEAEPKPAPVPQPVMHFETESEDAFEPAPFFPRAFAFFLDGAIVFSPVLVLFILGSVCIEVPAWWRGTNHQTVSEEWGLLGLNATRLSYLIIALGWLYGATFEASPAGATPGKKWLGLRVVGGDGQPIVFFRAVGRNVGKYLSGAIFFFGYFMALFGRRHLALHDRLSDTRVVRV